MTWRKISHFPAADNGGEDPTEPNEAECFLAGKQKPSLKRLSLWLTACLTDLQAAKSADCSWYTVKLLTAGRGGGGEKSECYLIFTARFSLTSCEAPFCSLLVEMPFSLIKKVVWLAGSGKVWQQQIKEEW